jgi:(2Fe-2S) ferredoxin
MSDGHNLEAHLFVCTNSRENGADCASKGSADLRVKLRNICQDPTKNWHGRVRINASGCLGRCEKGIAAVLYPKAQWFENLGVNDTAAIEKALKETLG